jgi:hypothetical protein
MLTRVATAASALLCATQLIAQEPRQLIELRRAFESLARSTEADRVRYITRLVRLRESFTRADYKQIEAIDTEVIKYPMPSDVNSADLRKHLVGQWTSPRHNYLYRADGTWMMLPEFVDGMQATHGVWRIERNRFFQNASIQTPDLTGER